MGAIMQPCDAGVISCTRGAAPCHPSSRPWVIAATSLGSGMAFLDSTVMNVALPAMQVNLDLSAREVQWVFGAFAVVLAAFLLLGGTLGDHYSARFSLPPQLRAPERQRRSSGASCSKPSARETSCWRGWLTTGL